jgi:hypothetical protein
VDGSAACGVIGGTFDAAAEGGNTCRLQVVDIARRRQRRQRWQDTSPLPYIDPLE